MDLKFAIPPAEETPEAVILTLANIPVGEVFRFIHGIFTRDSAILRADVRIKIGPDTWLQVWLAHSGKCTFAQSLLDPTTEVQVLDSQLIVTGVRAND